MNYDLGTIPFVNVGNTLVKYEHSVTSLGFRVNRYLSCKDQINFMVSKMHFIMRRLWSSANFVPEDVKLKLVKTFLIPVMSYSGLIYGNLDSESKHKLQLAINSAARYVYRKRKFDHISLQSKTIINCDLSTFYKIQNLLFLQKLINTHCPMYLFEKLNFSRSSRTCNLIVSDFNYLVTSRLFFVSVVKQWNDLPNDIKLCRDSKRFKLAINRLFL